MNTNVNVAIERTATFSILNQTVVKAQNNELLFNIIKQAIERKSVTVIVTPRVDKGGYPYYWVGVRNEFKELNFKLLVTEQISNFILAYLSGAEALPNVTDFNPSEKIENVEEWLANHQSNHFMGGAISYREDVSIKEGVSYLTRKLIFKNGKISYPPFKYEDVLSIIEL